MDTTNYEDERRLHGCCQKNKLSACLAVLVTSLIFVIFSTCVSFLYFGFAEVSSHCTTSSCINASAEIAQLIDDSLDPCHDFYNFVCGKLVKNPESNYLKHEYAKTQTAINSLIVEPVSSDDPKEVKMQKQFYQSCINTSAIDLDRDKTFSKQLNTVGGWPFLQHTRWIEKDFDWIKYMIRARSLRLPFEWFLSVDLHFDRGQYQLKLSQPKTCGEYPNDDYFTMQRDILEKLRKPGIDAIVEFANLEDFERKLNSICINMTDSGVLVRKASNLWLDGIGPVPTFLSSITGLKGWKSNSWVGYNHNYMFELNHLLRLTPKKTQAMYILWKIIEFYAPHLSKPIRDKYFTYLELLNGGNASREEFCLEETKSKFKYVSEVTHLKGFITPEIRDEGKSFISSITEEMTKNIVNETIKKLHLDFYNDVEEVIIGPEEMFDDDDTEYLQIGQLLFLSDNIIHMLNTWSQKMFEVKMGMIGKPFLSLDSVFGTDETYSVTLDDQLLPALTFYTFFKSDSQKYINYAELGTIIGEKMIQLRHLLNKNESQYHQKLEVSGKCLMDSFKNLNRRLNTFKAFDANYGAWLGQILSYQAFQKASEEENLPGLSYTPNQLFWIKSSLTWCQQALLSDDSTFKTFHILKNRVNEAAKNSLAFAEDFACPPESPMNPQNKCVLTSSLS